jgi:tryptophan-rich sensory protein
MDVRMDVLDDDESLELEQPSWARSGAALGAFAGMTAAAAWLGSKATRRSVDGWYDGLDKPWFTPPTLVFGPVWTGLYVLSTLSAWRVWRSPRGQPRRTALALWGAQLVLNAAWSPLFFGLRRPLAALVDLVALAGAATAYTVVARRVDQPAAIMMIPYLGWVGFAGVLNAELWRRNR